MRHNDQDAEASLKRGQEHCVKQLLFDCFLFLFFEAKIGVLEYYARLLLAHSVHT
jgi:hypothetical protein